MYVYLRLLNAIVWYTVWMNIDIRIEEFIHPDWSYIVLHFE